MNQRRRFTRLTRLELRDVPAVGGGFANAGLVGEYFNNTALAGMPSFTRRDVRVDFDWGTVHKPGGSGSPGYATLGADNYSARWTGQLIPEFSETYTFHATAADGVRLFLKPADTPTWSTVVDQWVNQAEATFTGTFALTAGQAYDVRLEMYEATGPAVTKLYWSSPSTPLEVIEPLLNNGDHIDGEGEFIFADAMKVSRFSWQGLSGGPAPGTDAAGNPLGNGELVVWEGAQQPYFGGTYNARFTGRADISAFPGEIKYQRIGDPTIYNSLTSSQIWNSTTNVSEFRIVVPANLFNSPFVLRLNNTRRLPSDTTATGITNLEIMRPRTVGGADPYPYGTAFTDAFKQANDVYTHYRWLDTNGDLSENNWADRVTPAFNKGILRGISGATVARKGWNYEYQIRFANETGKDLYLTVPMRATNDYMLQLARLVRFGSDASGTPYTAPTANPVHPPLNPNLKAYFELSNEVWNTAGPFGQSRQADDDAVAAGLAPAGSAPRAEWNIINYDGVLNTTDTGGYNTFDMRRLKRWHALRTVRMSEQIRAVYGDDMHEVARVMLFWQYNNANNTALHSLKFIDDYFNNSGGNFVTTPQPVGYYIWAAGGASYYGSGNSKGTLATDPITNAGFETNGGLALNQAHVRPTTVSGWTFTGNAGVYGRATSTPAPTYTSDGFSMGTPFNPTAGNYAGYVMRGGRIARSFTLTQSGRYAVGFSGTGSHDIPLDFLANGQRITPNYLIYAGVGEPDPATGPKNIGYSWNTNFGAGWDGDLTTATFEITVPAGGSVTVNFEVIASPISVPVGNPNYAAQAGQYMLFDQFYVGSIDRIFEGGIPNTGQALGQVAAGTWTNDRNQIAQYAQAYGVRAASYESGWSMGGDNGASPLQNWAKYRDQRATIANRSAIDIHSRAGYSLVSYGVYEQYRAWDITTANQFPLMQGFAAENQELPADFANGVVGPQILTRLNQTLAYTGSGTSWNYSRTADANLANREWLMWNVIVPRSGTYQVTSITGAGGTQRMQVGETLLNLSGPGGTPLTGTVYLPAGMHAVRVRSTSGTVAFDRIIFTQADAPAAPVLTAATDGDTQFSAAWTAVAGATGYRLRYGIASGVYGSEVDVGNVTNFTVNGVANGTTYFVAVSAYNANGTGLPSNEAAVTPLLDGQLGNLANWELTGFIGGEANAPRTSGSGRVSVGALTRGPGLTPSSGWVHEFFPNRFSSFGNSSNAFGQTLTDSINLNQYYQFTVTPTANNVMSLTSLSLMPWFNNNADGVGVGVRYSTNGSSYTTLYDSGSVTNPQATYTVDLSGIAALQNSTANVIFRVFLYGPANFGATAIGAGTSANDLTVTGSTRARPLVESVVVDDGSGQRSRVRSLAVSFNRVVTLDAGAFALTRAGGGSVTPSWTTATIDGRTVATLTWTGANTEAGSLVDGNWTLTVNAAAVRLADAPAVTMATNATATFHRLYGDSDGNRTVDFLDFLAFRASFGASGPGNIFDSDGNSAIDFADFLAFRTRFGVTLVP